MAFLLSIILGPVIYFLFGWISSSIYYSIYPAQGADLISDLIVRSALIYAIVASVYNFIMVILKDDTTDDTEVYFILTIVAIPIVSWFLCYKLFPISEAATILNYILCLGSMVICGYRGWSRLI